MTTLWPSFTDQIFKEDYIAVAMTWSWTSFDDKLFRRYLQCRLFTIDGLLWKSHGMTQFQWSTIQRIPPDKRALSIERSWHSTLSMVLWITHNLAFLKTEKKGEFSYSVFATSDARFYNCYCTLWHVRLAGQSTQYYLFFASAGIQPYQLYCNMIGDIRPNEMWDIYFASETCDRNPVTGLTSKILLVYFWPPLHIFFSSAPHKVISM